MDDNILKFWDILDKTEDNKLKRNKFNLFLNKYGFSLNNELFIDINKYFNKNDIDNDGITFEIFSNIFKKNIVLFTKIFENDLIIDKWDIFINEIKTIINEIKDDHNGNVADYIPQLAKVDPNIFSVSICTVDGQSFDWGNIDHKFCMQSCIKPINYLIGLDLHGEDIVHNFIGKEPSGRNFNELCLNQNNIPHNPLINSGAIMAVSLINTNKSQSERFDLVMNYLKLLSGDNNFSFDNSVFQSERDSADRNKCIAYMMQEKQSFQVGKDCKYKRDWGLDSLSSNLDLYFQCCSINSNNKSISKIAATLANGGINPITKKKVFNYNHVKYSLSLMLSCGMYDYSGEWAYHIGLPAKSGVSGLIYVIIPGIMGISVFSPPLDKIGNSYKGIEFFKKLTKSLNLHIFDLHKDSKLQILKNNSGTNYVDNEYINIYKIFNYACKNDLFNIIKLNKQGIDINQKDYDGRTALHLAASEGSLEVFNYLINNGSNINCKDRWGNTPLNDAIRENKINIIEYINKINTKDD